VPITTVPFVGPKLVEPHPRPVALTWHWVRLSAGRSTAASLSTAVPEVLTQKLVWAGAPTLTGGTPSSAPPQNTWPAVVIPQI
jgi:hypothetical protein